MPITYREFEPALALRPLVDAYWIFRCDGPPPPDLDHSMPPDGAITFWVSRRRKTALILGPRTEPLRADVRDGDAVHAIRFWPGAGGAILGTDVSKLRNQAVPLSDWVTSDWAEDLVAAMTNPPSDYEAIRRFDHLCAPLVTKREHLDVEVMQAVFAIIHSRERMSVVELATMTGLSGRSLRRRFASAVGLSVKQLLRIRRLRASVVEALECSRQRWVELAATYGYADQAHLIHEFQRLAGLAPENLLMQLKSMRPMLVEQTTWNSQAPPHRGRGFG